MFTKAQTNQCKGIAILMMLFHHLFNDYEEYAGYAVEYWPLTGDQTLRLALLCKLCVTVFVFLSGYGIAASYTANFQNQEPSKAQFWRFTVSRCWKLMSGYWFVFLLALVCAPLGRTPAQAYGTDGKTALVYFVIDFFGLSFAFHTPTLNPTWWYLSVALYIAVLMPFVMKLAKKTGTLPVLAAAMGLLQLMEIQSVASTYVFGMLLGAACFEWDAFGRWSRLFAEKKAAYAAKTVFLLAATLLLLKFRTNYNYCGIVDGLASMTLCGLCAALCQKFALLAGGLEFLGKHSANMFLMHNLMYSYYFLGFYYSLRYPVLILAVLTATSALASAAAEKLKVWTGYERQMKKAGERLCRLGEKI